MKKSLYLFAAGILFCACTSSPIVFKNPESLADNTHGFESTIEVSGVELTDTATLLTFKVQVFYQTFPPYMLSIQPEAVLSDMKGREYHALFIKGHNLGEYFSPTGADSTFTVGFEPMPKNTRIFDFIEGPNDDYFRIVGIHDSGYRIKSPSFSKKELKDLDNYRKNYFRKGAAVLRGTIKDYDSKKELAATIYYNDYFVGNQVPLAIDIDENGRFERSFNLDCPKADNIVLKDGNNQTWNDWYLEPGDTLDMTIDLNGTNSFSLSDGREYRLANISRYGLLDMDLFRGQMEFEYKDTLELDLMKNKAAKYLKQSNEFADYAAVRYNLSAFEYTYLKCRLQKYVFESYLDYRMYATIPHFSSNEITYEEYTSTMSKINDALSDKHQLDILRDFQFAYDPILLSLPGNWIIYNRYGYDPAFKADCNDDDIVREYLMEDSICLENDRQIFGSDNNSILGLICTINNFNKHLDYLRSSAESEQDDSVVILGDRYVESFKTLLADPKMEAQSDRLYQVWKRNLSPYWEIPEGKGKQVLQKILANYPSKYVFFDFWSTSCGPCVSGIKSLKQNHPELMTSPMDNFVIVFVTSDPEHAYQPFYDEYLKGAQSYRLSQVEYNALADLFSFSGIPHNELITPDGLATRDVPGLEWLSLGQISSLGK